MTIGVAGQPHPYDIDEKLKSLVVSVDFTNAKIDEALRALSILSKQRDFEHKGVEFIIDPDAGAEAQLITLKLENVPLGETIRYVCELGRVHYKVRDKLVEIAPMFECVNELRQRTFHIDPSFVEAVSSAGVIPSATTP